MPKKFSLDLLIENLIICIKSNEQNDFLLKEIAKILGQTFDINNCFILSSNTEKYFETIEFWHKSYLKKKVKGDILNQINSHEEIIDNIDNYEPFIIEKILIDNVQNTLLGIYTYYKNKVNGLIILANSENNKWTKEEQNILIQVKNILGIVLNLQSLEKTNQATFDFIFNLTQKLRKESDQDKTLNLIFTETAKIFNADRGLIFLLKYSESAYKSKRNKNLEAKINLLNEWVSNKEINKTKTCSFSIENCILCQKLLDDIQETLIINDISNNFSEEQLTKINSIFKIQKYQGIAFIPLIHSSQSVEKPFVILGWLILQHIKPYFWTIENQILVNWMSLQLSNIIIQNKALRQVQNIVDERTSQLKWSLDVQNKLSEKMRQQIQQLKHLNQLKDDFMSSMSHELNTPLATMKMALKMLRQTGNFSERQTRYLDILEQEWNRESNLIKDLLKLQQLESQQFILNLKEIEVEPILDKAFDDFKQRWSEKGLKLQWNINTIRNPLKIYTDEESFTSIINELLLNAGKYSIPETLIMFNLDQEIKLDKENIILEISNYGNEISTDEMQNIFNKFRRGNDSTDKAIPGTGLGLTLVKMLVQQLNGIIEVTNEKDTNSDYFITTFTVILPRLKM